MYNKHTHFVSVFPTSQQNDEMKWDKWLKTIWAKEDSKGVNSTKNVEKIGSKHSHNNGLRTEEITI